MMKLVTCSALLPRDCGARHNRALIATAIQQMRNHAEVHGLALSNARHGRLPHPYGVELTITAWAKPPTRH